MARIHHLDDLDLLLARDLRIVARLGDRVREGGLAALAGQAVLGRVGQPPADVGDADVGHGAEAGGEGAEGTEVAELGFEGGAGGVDPGEGVAVFVGRDGGPGRERGHGEVGHGRGFGGVAGGVGGVEDDEFLAEGVGGRADVLRDGVLGGAFGGDGDGDDGTFCLAVDGGGAVDLDLDGRHGWIGWCWL